MNAALKTFRQIRQGTAQPLFPQEIVARMGEICLLVLICQVLVCILQGTISRRFCY